MTDLRGKRAFVVGGGRGIGRGIALGLAGAGSDVAIGFQRDSAAADWTAERAREQGVRGTTIMCDATDPARVEAAVASVVDALGGIDILIHAAGVQSRIPFLKLSFDEWRRVLATNLDGAFAVGQAVARRMVDAGSGGAMVFVSSVAQEGVAPNMTHYAVSKAGLLSLVRMMAYELAPHRVRVNALAPGLTETDINRADLADQGFREMRMSRIPLGFIGEPDDQVGAALFLVSPEARYVTGSCVTVDGGSSMLGPASLYPG